MKAVGRESLFRINPIFFERKGDVVKELLESLRVMQEKTLLEFMQGVFNSGIIARLLDWREGISPGISPQADLKKYCLPVSDRIGSNIYGVCTNVATLLGFDDKEIEFYISNSQEVNAASFFSRREGEASSVVLNAGLLEKLTDNELAFVVGHEIGHLIYEHSSFTRIIQFVYPDFNKLPPLVKSLYVFWTKLSEISADRIGLLAARDFHSAVSAMFKISSGLDGRYVEFDSDAFLEMTDEVLVALSKSAGRDFYSHPANPIRVKALKHFHESKRWKSAVDGRVAEEDEELSSKTDELVGLLKRRPSDDQEMAELQFLASAGTILMACDDDLSDEERDYLMNVLAEYVFFPPHHMDWLLGEDPLEVMKKSGEFIVEKCPHRREELMGKLVPLIFRDRKLRDEEVNTCLGIAVDHLKIPLPMAVDVLLNGIRRFYLLIQ